MPSPGRLGRSTKDLIPVVAGLRHRGIGFQSFHEASDTTPRAAAWSSTCAQRSRSSSGNSSCRAPARAGRRPALAASASGGRRP
ncbi:hypothetical protein ACIBJF_46655 [Streptomyces sp. NPDC050743]|uniref:hypothetical protein n=1 Tax=Streptomyces sp. NPDC050743 TaxID=3365634 RepID=UPI0037B43661